jgi:hypothetical protein
MIFAPLASLHRRAMGVAMAAFRPALLLALTLLASACSTTEGEFPSLARRPAERVSGTAEPAPAPPIPTVAEPVAPDLAARLARIEASARSGHAKFLSREPRARSTVGAARGAVVASESWSVATVAVAELEAARSEVMIALADLDSLYAAERVAGSDGVAVGLVRDRVVALVVQEDRVLAELGGRLAQ